MFQSQIKKCLQKGLTLVEIIVTIGIFSIILVGISGIYISASRVQRHTLLTQEVLDQTSYALEYMGRTLRMAKKDSANLCLAGLNCNYENPGGDTTRIKILNYNGITCQEFLLEDGQIKESIDGGLAVALTSSDVQVDFAKFNLLNPCESDSAQSRVTVSLNIKTGTEEDPEITIQTTVSQRELNTPK